MSEVNLLKDMLNIKHELVKKKIEIPFKNISTQCIVTTGLFGLTECCISERMHHQSGVAS